MLSKCLNVNCGLWSLIWVCCVFHLEGNCLYFSLTWFSVSPLTCRIWCNWVDCNFLESIIYGLNCILQSPYMVAEGSIYELKSLLVSIGARECLLHSVVIWLMICMVSEIEEKGVIGDTVAASQYSEQCLCLHSVARIYHRRWLYILQVVENLFQHKSIDLCEEFPQFINPIQGRWEASVLFWEQSGRT